MPAKRRTSPSPSSTAFVWIGRAYNSASTAFEAATGVKAARWRILFIVHRQKSCTQKYLIEQIRVDPGSITRQIKMLEDEGLIEREADPLDNRLTRVKLSPSGEAFVRRVLDQRQKFLEKMLEGIPAKDIDVCVRVLEQITGNLGYTEPLP